MGWNPSEFPPLPDGDVLEQHAGKLRTKAEGIQSAAEESHTLWAGMSTAYKGPGDWQVHNAFNKVASEAEVVLEDANAVADAVDTFAEWAREAKRRYNALYADWLAVQSRIDDGGDDWREDQDLVNDDNNILKSADALLAEHMEAERTCATAISGLFDGPSYVVTTQDGPGANQVAYGYTADQLDAAAAEGNIPWGEPTEWDKPWYRDALDGVVSFGKGVWSGITGTVTGLWNMVNFTDMETFSATWKGIGTLALDVAIVATPVAQVALRATGNKHIVDQSAERLVAVGKAAVHWDDWKRDPAYAAGASAFDLASILLTAGGGAVAKTGSVASAVTRVGSTGSRVASVVNATGLTKIAGYTGRVIDLGSALKINTVNFATDTARVTLGRVAPAAVRVDNFINDVGASLSGPRPAYAGVSTGNGSGPVSTRIDNLINRFDAEGPVGPGRGSVTDTTPVRGTGAPDPARADGTKTPDKEQTGGSTSNPASTGDGSARSTDSTLTGVKEPDEAPPGTAATSAADTEDAAVRAGEPEASLGDVPPEREPDGNGADDRPGRLVRAADGTPERVVFRDGTEHTVTTDLGSLRQADAWEDVRGALEQHGKDEEWLRRTVAADAEDLSLADAEALRNIRRSIPSPDLNTLFQKVVTQGQAEALFDPSNTYRTGTVGYISRAEHTSGLRTPQQIHDGLRLDYESTPYLPDNSKPVFSIRFRTSDTGLDQIRVADGRLDDHIVQQGGSPSGVPEIEDYNVPSTKRDPAPNMGHGFTGSTDLDTDLVPEEVAEIRNGKAVQFRDGAELWENNASGQEVLAGVYDGFSQTWRRVLSSIEGFE
jgi:hypothetical protein